MIEVAYDNFALLIMKTFAKGPEFNFAFSSLDAGLRTFDAIPKDAQNKRQSFQVRVLEILLG
jgi:hypothetical protein